MNKTPQLSRNISGREPMIIIDERVRRMREYAEGLVREGFEEREYIIDMVEDYAHGASPDLVDLPLADMVDQLLQAHYARQAAWGFTDCDRLDTAFDTLNARGIVARQHFACCSSCGHAEIWGEAGPDSHGYAFYHYQDTEAAAAGYGLYIAYGAADNSDEANAEVGAAIVEALREQGLMPEWNGSIHTRIKVMVEWQRRRPVELL